MNMHWDCETLWERVVAMLPGFTVEVLPQVDSTNSELMRRARAGQLEPVLLIAEHQTAGRGRLGREWLGGVEAAGPSGLTFSLGMPFAPPDWSGLSLAVGLSLAQSLHPDIRLKWPNDLWLHGRKLAGILIETTAVNSVRYVVIGAGINIVKPGVTGLSTAPAWLQELQPAWDARQALGQLFAPLVQTLLSFEQTGFEPFRTTFNALDALANTAVRLSDGTTGVAQGVDRLGALQVLTRQGLQKISSAEVSVRPSLGPTNHQEAPTPC